MSTSRFLTELWQQGVVLRLNGDRSRILVPRRQLTPELQVRLAHHRPEILQLLGFADDYQALIRNAFAILADRSSAPQGLRELADDQARLTDELGAELTSAIRDREAGQWRLETGLCPVCWDEGSCDACEETDEDDRDD
jgi:hypothetical protein